MSQSKRKTENAKRLASLFVKGNRDRIDLKTLIGCSDRSLYRLLDDPAFYEELKRQNYKGPFEFIRRKPGRKV